MPASDGPVTFVSRIARMGNRYIISVPKQYRDLAENLHGKYVIVTVIPVEEAEKSA